MKNVMADECLDVTAHRRIDDGNEDDGDDGDDEANEMGDFGIRTLNTPIFFPFERRAGFLVTQV